jgi:hypothetical protein
MRWIRVTWGDACFGVGIDDDGKIAAAAPLVGWAIGKQQHVLADWLRAKGARFERADGPVITNALVPPSTRFWCEVCNGMHPMSEHAACREAGPPPVAHAQAPG